MFGQIWNNGNLRKYVVYFGNLFNEIYIQRDDAAGDVVQTMKVPLNYGPKEKFLARLEGNPTLDRPVAIQLPRMSFEMTNFSYAADRKLSSIGRISALSTDPTRMSYQYNPIPYDIEFSLYIMVKNAEDGTRIIEQILPYFTPEWTGTLNILQDISASYDIPVIINSVTQEDTYEGNFETRRALIWTLTFTMKAYLFGPTRTGDIITQAEISIKNVNYDTDVYDATANTTANTVVVTVRPGLTANGQPTSNASLSISRNLITANDNYGFIRDFEENI